MNRRDVFGAVALALVAPKLAFSERRPSDDLWPPPSGYEWVGPGPFHRLERVTR